MQPLSTLLQRLDHERRRLALDAHVLESLPNITRVRAADHSHHNIAWSALTTENADAIISNEIDHHRRLNVPFEWKLYAHDTPPDLIDRLKNHGLTIGPREAVMIYDLTTPPIWPTSTRVDCIDTLAQVAIYRKVAEEIFNKNYNFTATELAQALQSKSTQHQGYIAYADNNPVAIARLYTHPKSHFAGLYGGATLPAHRHHGHYRALLAARAKDALAANAKYLLVDALPTSRPILEKLGFQHLTNTWPCEWSPIQSATL